MSGNIGHGSSPTILLLLPLELMHPLRGFGSYIAVPLPDQATRLNVAKLVMLRWRAVGEILVERNVLTADYKLPIENGPSITCKPAYWFTRDEFEELRGVDDRVRNP